MFGQPFFELFPLQVRQLRPSQIRRHSVEMVPTVPAVPVAGNKARLAVDVDSQVFVVCLKVSRERRSLVVGNRVFVGRYAAQLDALDSQVPVSDKLQGVAFVRAFGADGVQVPVFVAKVGVIHARFEQQSHLAGILALVGNDHALLVFSAAPVGPLGILDSLAGERLGTLGQRSGVHLPVNGCHPVTFPSAMAGASAG
ncbi:MAG: hypothetical protein QUV05_18390 [Phycisphaerae bacterium]|nr:hypothetical protein [Phycisphaerae bacterium]